MTSQGTHRLHEGEGAAQPVRVRGSDGPRTSSSGTSGTTVDIAPGQTRRPPQASPQEWALRADPEEVARLGRALTQALERALEGQETISLLFSGGLDSSLLAFLAKRWVEGSGGRQMELVTIGVPGALDLSQAGEAAGLLGLPWRPTTVQAADVRAAKEEVARLLGQKFPGRSFGGMPLEVQTGLALGLRASSYATVLCGQGADELFLGYAHFLPLREQALLHRYREDLRRLVEEDLPASHVLAGAAGHQLVAPYLDPAFVERVERVPLELRRPARVPKGLLRVVGHRLGLPGKLADRPKKALQYGSGVHAALAAR